MSIMCFADCDKKSFSAEIKSAFLFWRKRVVDAVFKSVLDYGDVFCQHASSTLLKVLDSVYHSALRFITSDVYHHHIKLHFIGQERVVFSERQTQYLLVFFYLQSPGWKANALFERNAAFQLIPTLIVSHFVSLSPAGRNMRHLVVKVRYTRPV